MKVELSFNLPEEEDDFRAAINGQKLRGITYDFDQWLRNQIKYEDLTDEEYQTFQKCRDQFRAMFYDEYLFITQ
jgi:hypothetical protein